MSKSSSTTRGSVLEEFLKAVDLNQSELKRATHAPLHSSLRSDPPPLAAKQVLQRHSVSDMIA